MLPYPSFQLTMSSFPAQEHTSSYGEAKERCKGLETVNHIADGVSQNGRRGCMESLPDRRKICPTCAYGCGTSLTLSGGMWGKRADETFETFQTFGAFIHH